jgi:hypothetical protein
MYHVGGMWQLVVPNDGGQLGARLAERSFSLGW